MAPPHAEPLAPVPAAGELPRVDAPVRGDRLLDLLDAAWKRLEIAGGGRLGTELNPLTQAGAVVNTLLVLATVTGVLLLFWYTPSVHGAFRSVEAMSEAPFTAGLLRSLHRYTSDGAMLFIVLHAIKMLTARRFTGPRWLAWVTGVLLVGFVWAVGWTGYWLVWDERAQQVAVGTAHVLDALPIFVDPLARAFLADATVGSLLFFVVFFLHMLLPLALGLGCWIHITRLSRARFLTRRHLTLWILGSLVLLSLVLPAGSAEPAHMEAPPAGFTMDWWYLAPIALTDRLGAGALWAVILLTPALVSSLPWVLPRRLPVVAVVDPRRCDACELCVQDCPFEAIRMVPRSGPHREGYPSLVAEVNPARCTGCGICAGSCNPAAIGLPWVPAPEWRRNLDQTLARAMSAGAPARVAFVCVESGAAAPAGWLAEPVPCAGWVHALSVERVLRRGATEVRMIGCAPGCCRYREGANWTEERLRGVRAPALRTEKVPPGAVRFEEHPCPPRARRGLASAALITGLLTLVAAGSDFPYAAPAREGAELVVSFKHPGELGESCRELTAEEKAALPVHMRRDRVCERGRVPVRLRVAVDGRTLLDRAYAPRGLWSDGNSVAIERLPLEPGEHRVEVFLGDSPDSTEWTFHEGRTLELRTGRRRVVLFDRVAGFAWH